MASSNRLGAMLDETPKRAKPYSYRPPKRLTEEFEQRAKESGLSVNAFITECVFGRTRHRPSELKALARIRAACANIADDMRRIGARPERAKSFELEEIARELALIRSALMSLMGRKS